MSLSTLHPSLSLSESRALQSLLSFVRGICPSLVPFFLMKNQLPAILLFFFNYFDLGFNVIGFKDFA